MRTQAQRFAELMAREWRTVRYHGKGRWSAEIPGVGQFRFWNAANDPAVVVQFTTRPTLVAPADTMHEGLEAVGRILRNVGC